MHRCAGADHTPAQSCYFALKKTTNDRDLVMGVSSPYHLHSM